MGNICVEETMKFEDFEFGFADAEKEYTRIPEIFERAFYDSRKIIDKLINGYQCILIGRKGVGKSAYSAKIQTLANNDKDKNLYAFPLQLNDFEFSTFSKTNIGDDVTGTQKYKTSWDFILLLMIYKILHTKMQIEEVESFSTMLSLLEVLGFPANVGYKKDVLRLSKIKVGTDVLKFDVEFERVFGEKPSTYLERISTLNDRMLDVLTDVWLDKQKIVILIDGVDDILRFRKNKIEILSSLVRSIDYLNDKFVSMKIPVKTILFIREDIMNTIVDPDLNKIKRDGAIYLGWQNRIDDLHEIVKLRFLLSGVSVEEVDKCWGKMFPKFIKGKESWSYVLDHTLAKPRDILQFLKCCQEIYPEKDGLSYSEMNAVLKEYSKEYFIEEMKNEITGFISDSIVVELPAIFQKIGDKKFTYREFSELINSHTTRKLEDNDIKYLLLLLFDSGYIGQLYNNGRNKKMSVVFKYRNTSAKIDYGQMFITHQGLHSGLGIRKK